MSARRTTATAAAALLALTLATTACSDDGGDGGGGGSKAIPTAWSAQDAQNASDKAGDQQDNATIKAIPSTEKWTYKLAPESAMVAYDDWPEANTILSREQMMGLFPGAGKFEAGACSFGQYGQGNQTSKNTTCTWKLDSDPKEYSPNSTFRVKLRGVGADSEVTKSWDAQRETYRKEGQQGDTFYQDGTYGARRALFRPGTGLGSMVISDGQIAAWIDLQFEGEFPFVSPQDVSKVPDVIRTQVFPVAVSDLVGKLPRQYS